jgi:steroid delta-isomerase-like uncharacterized protein
MQVTPASIMQQWFDGLWNAGDESTLDRFLAADGVVHGLATPDGEPIRGPQGFAPFYRAFRGAFPDVHIEVVHSVTEGDWTVAHCRVTGTHAGDGLGLPATGKPVTFYGFALGRMAGGQIVEAYNCFDFLSMYQQLGVSMDLPR